MHLKETRRAQNGGKAFLQFQNKRPAWAFAQGIEAFVLLRDEPGLKALEGTVTLCAVRKPGLQVFGRRAEFAKPPLLFFAEIIAASLPHAGSRRTFCGTRFPDIS